MADQEAQDAPPPLPAEQNLADKVDALGILATQMLEALQDIRTKLEDLTN